MKVVSACLAGYKCNWQGKSKPCQEVIELVKQGKAIPVCPEQLGGLSTPRPPAEIKEEKVLRENGEDVTTEFEKGAQIALKIAQDNNCTKAILKSKSPACGVDKIYDGTFSKKLINGDGIFTQLLKNNNIQVKTEKEL